MAKTQPRDREPALFETIPPGGKVVTGDVEGSVKATAVQGEVNQTIKPETKRRKQTIIHANPNVPATPGAGPHAVVPLSDFQATLATFERLAVNRDVNPESLGRLLDVQERLLDRRARDAFDEHLIALQEELPVFAKDGVVTAEGQSRTSGRDYKAKFRFPKWETVKPRLTPILKRHGFVLTHRTSASPVGDGKMIRVTAVVRGWGHTDDSCYLDGDPDTTGAKNAVQARNSTVSYLKRITAFAALGLVAAEEDDDAAAAGGPVVVGEPLTPEQTQQLFDLCRAVRIKRENLLALMNRRRPSGHPEASEIGQLPASRFEEAVAELRAVEAYDKEQAAKAAKAGEMRS